MGMQKMKGKNVIVTGSGTGIGKEIALEFARSGANVVFHYGHSADGAKGGVEEAKKLGVKSTSIRADFSKLDDVLKLAEEAIAFLGHVDILVNNAGITFNKPFLNVEPEQFKKMYDVNIGAQFFLTQTIVRNMIELDKGGAVCNITSIHGVSGAPEHSVYAGTKGAIIAYTRALAVELAHKGIRVNAIAPGCVPVENYKEDFPDYDAKEFENIVKDMIPVGRSGKPIEIAKLAIFLCSDEAEFIIGQTIIADGGTTSLMSLISDFRNESSAHFGANYL